MIDRSAAKSVWRPIGEFPTSELRPWEEVDVCVVGAGIAGATVAYRAALEGASVLLVDDGAPGSGMTGRTSAHLSSTIDDRFYEVARLRGADAARLAYESHAVAIDFIERTAMAERIDCGFRRVDGYLFNPPGEGLGVLEKEFAAASAAGTGVERVDRAPWPEYETGPCLLFPRQAEFQPLKYLGGLLERFTTHGGRFAPGVHVQSFVGGERARVETSDHKVIRAGSIVVATNSPVNDRLTLHLKQIPYMTYAIALTIALNEVPHGLYWDTADPYHYVRVVSDSEGPGTGDLLVVGGEDHRTGQQNDQKERFERLECWGRLRFPRAGAVRRHWSGQVLETFDGLAHIGRNPLDAENVYVATGDSGMGLTHGTIAGLLLVDLIQGRSNPWEAVYDPSRKAPAGNLSEFAIEGLKSVAPYVEWLTPGDVSDIDGIPENEGAVVRVGLNKTAVFRDEQGALHACSATCPHLGAIVHWNSAEKTWDCPAHGSRFDCRGKALTGPANSDLEKLVIENDRARRDVVHQQ